MSSSRPPIICQRTARESMSNSPCSTRLSTCGSSRKGKLTIRCIRQRLRATVVNLRAVAAEARATELGVWRRDATSDWSLAGQESIGPDGQLILPKLSGGARTTSKRWTGDSAVISSTGCSPVQQRPPGTRTIEYFFGTLPRCISATSCNSATSTSHFKLTCSILPLWRNSRPPDRSRDTGRCHRAGATRHASLHRGASLG
jgi:hypothetical protein